MMTRMAFTLLIAVAVVCSFGFASFASTATDGQIVRRFTEAQAKSAAVERVRGDLNTGKLAAWGGHSGGGIRPASVAASRTLFNPTGGKDGGPIYVVLLGAPGAKGQVRVIVNATSGSVISSVHRDFGSGSTPDWWVKGLDTPSGR